MRTVVFLMFLLIPGFGALAQSDQDEFPESGPGYELREAGDGFVRLNRKTGAISYCRVVTGNLVCLAGEEEREAYLETIDDLETRLDLAEDRIARLESGLRDNETGAAEPDEPDDSIADTDPETDSEGDEFDRAAEFAERALRRFFDVVKELREDLEARPQESR